MISGFIFAGWSRSAVHVPGTVHCYQERTGRLWQTLGSPNQVWWFEVSGEPGLQVVLSKPQREEHNSGQGLSRLGHPPRASYEGHSWAINTVLLDLRDGS